MDIFKKKLYLYKLEMSLSIDPFSNIKTCFSNKTLTRRHISVRTGAMTLATIFKIIRAVVHVSFEGRMMQARKTVKRTLGHFI